jgi:serine/threonine-protein kinase
MADPSDANPDALHARKPRQPNSATPATALAALPVRHDVVGGKYRIERTIGSGGMGNVYAATHVGLGTTFALKVLRSSEGAESHARFEREARATASLRSEHVARVIDFGWFQDAPFMVLELLEGRDLDQEICARGRLPAAEAVDLVLQACDGLAEAHAAGIIHRDIKPSNLFLARRSNGATVLKVLDFGISKRVDGDESLTGSATMLGSPLFMAPEQIRSAKHVDVRVDVWALGVVLFQALTGQLPFRGDGVSSTLAAVMIDEPPDVRALCPETSADLEAIVRRCLQKNPAFRYRGVAELAMALAPHASPGGRQLAERLAPRAHAPQESVGRLGTTLDESTSAPISPEARTDAASTWDPPLAPSRAPAPRRRRMLAGLALTLTVVVGASIGSVLWLVGARSTRLPVLVFPPAARAPTASVASFAVSSTPASASAPAPASVSAPVSSLRPRIDRLPLAGKPAGRPAVAPSRPADRLGKALDSHD